MEKQNDGEQPVRPAVDMILRVSRTHKRIVERRIAALGIHGGQHHMLMMLSRLGQIPAQNELARRMDISPASAAGMLKRLESGGYIARSTRSSDGRCNEVSITEKGGEVIAHSIRIFEDINERMFAGVSAEERAQLRAVLGKIHENLRSMEEELDGGAEDRPRPDEEGNETRH